ncbi:FAD-dependent monooxygenase [Mycolicibacterium helvum]
MRNIAQWAVNGYRQRMRTKTILISGASLAGPATAFWLVRAGFKVTLVEQAAELRKGGNGVDIRSEALTVIDRMGLTEAAREHALETHGMRFVDRHGRQRASIATAGLERMVGSEDIEVRRGDLARLLVDATGCDVEYVFGDSITALTQDSGGVDVTFASGSQRRFDLVVGADGFHSAVRRLVFGPEEDFRVFKQHYYAIASADLPVGQDYWTTFYNEPGKSAAIYRAPERGRGLVNFTFRSPSPLSYDYRDMGAQRRLLRQAFGELGWHVPAMLDAVDSAPDFYFDALAQVQMPSWSKGRVVLVGDAAYCASPASGAGALLALSGSYRLAGELAAGDQPQAAFMRYESAQRPLVASKQSHLFTGFSVPKTRPGILVRNLVVSTHLTSLLSRQHAGKSRSLRAYEFPRDR